MQTAKIKIDGVYALKRGGGELVRFMVKEIVTRRTSNDGQAENQIVGFVVEDHTDDSVKPDLLKLSPSVLIGPYAEQTELVKRQQEEKAAAEARATEQLRAHLADREMLYRFVGEAMPAEADKYGQMFYVRYNKLETSREGVQALIDKIRSSRLRVVA